MAMGFGSWVDGLLIGGSAGGGGVLMLSFMKLLLSRNKLDTTQFDSLSQTLSLMRGELERERQERAKERREWREYEANLKSEINRLSTELTKTQAKLAEFQTLFEHYKDGQQQQ